MRRAVVLGGAPGVWDELAQVRQWCCPDAIIATNHAGRDIDEPFDHWASFHAELFPLWTTDRIAAGRPMPAQLWTVERRLCLPGFPYQVRTAANWAGSSGLLAVTVALSLGFDRVAVCGVPLDYDAGHYDNPLPWRQGGLYRRGWVAHLAEMRGRVKTMGGWTAAQLGAASEEWFVEDQAN